MLCKVFYLTFQMLAAMLVYTLFSGFYLPVGSPEPYSLQAQICLYALLAGAICLLPSFLSLLKIRRTCSPHSESLAGSVTVATAVVGQYLALNLSSVELQLATSAVLRLLAGIGISLVLTSSLEMAGRMGLSFLATVVTGLALGFTLGPLICAELNDFSPLLCFLALSLFNLCMLFSLALSWDEQNAYF